MEVLENLRNKGFCLVPLWAGGRPWKEVVGSPVSVLRPFKLYSGQLPLQLARSQKGILFKKKIVSRLVASMIDWRGVAVEAMEEQ